MGKVALLIGIASYRFGLNPLPAAWKNVEVLKRALHQARPSFDAIHCLRDRYTPQIIQEAIERLAESCQPDDFLLLCFSGYGIVDPDGKLYLATPITTNDNQGSLIKARTVPASFIQAVLNSSPAQQQLVIFDGYFCPASAEAITDPVHPVDLWAHLGGENRLLLTASSTMQPIGEPEGLDTWSYTRYFAEGLVTGAADTNYDGLLTIAELHEYASRKLQIAAPAMQPALSGTEAIAQYPVCHVDKSTSALKYRQFIEKLASDDRVDALGSRLLVTRQVMEDFRYHLGLSRQMADQIEFEVLRPIREYRQRLQLYQELFSRLAQGNHDSQP
ncbi:caspase family protein [Pantanalinema rosaneae CENA516]|uniref:caspase family protein n=1 Tax=Pantanalinema rosaneae TaxID=1620701 RepID=UPI003D6DAEEC